MKRPSLYHAALFFCAALIVFAPSAAAQKGSVEFVVRVTPSGGLEEPVRGFPVFLLTESYEDIQKEADTAFPKESLDDFIEGLAVSKELKKWMKTNKWITFSGQEFISKLKAEDIMNVPEFYQAYLTRNSGDQSAGFPEAKFKESEKTKDPAKYQKDIDHYRDSVKHYIQDVPESVNGIDLNLADIDPSRKWREVEAKRTPLVRRRLIELAQGKYFVARTETNLQGQGFFPNVPPGAYWVSTLDVAANVGDERPRWDVPVNVQAGKVAYAVLANVNAVQESAHDLP